MRNKWLIWFIQKISQLCFPQSNWMFKWNKETTSTTAYNGPVATDSNLNERMDQCVHTKGHLSQITTGFLGKRWTNSVLCIVFEKAVNRWNIKKPLPQFPLEWLREAALQSLKSYKQFTPGSHVKRKCMSFLLCCVLWRLTLLRPSKQRVKGHFQTTETDKWILSQKAATTILTPTTHSDTQRRWFSCTFLFGCQVPFTGLETGFHGLFTGLDSLEYDCKYSKRKG